MIVHLLSINIRWKAIVKLKSYFVYYSIMYEFHCTLSTKIHFSNSRFFSISDVWHRVVRRIRFTSIIIAKSEICFRENMTKNMVIAWLNVSGSWFECSDGKDTSTYTTFTKNCRKLFCYNSSSGINLHLLKALSLINSI